jgi:hypothetical protein
MSHRPPRLQSVAPEQQAQKLTLPQAIQTPLARRRQSQPNHVSQLAKAKTAAMAKAAEAITATATAIVIAATTVSATVTVVAQAVTTAMKSNQKFRRMTF